MVGTDLSQFNKQEDFDRNQFNNQMSQLIDHIQNTKSNLNKG